MWNIKFVRQYEAYNKIWYDVIYTSDRTFTYSDSNLPETVKKFIASASKKYNAYDVIMKRQETLYEKKED